MPKVNLRVRADVGAVAVVCVVSVAGGCGMVDTGVRVVEDGGTSSPTEPPTATAEGESVSVDAVEVLRDDPGVSQDVKDMVDQPCTAEEYNRGWFPVYTRYTSIAGPDIPVVIIDVQGCDDAVACTGVQASYVYRLWEDRTERIYTTTEPMGQVTARGSELVLQRPIWERGDPPACPGGSDTIALTWNGSELVTEDER